MPVSKLFQEHRNLTIGLAVLSGIILLLVFHFVNPAESALFPKCFFLGLTGWYCPGCGSQRAIHALLNGNFVQAAGFNLFLVASIPLLAVLVFQKFRNRNTDSENPSINWPSVYLFILLGGVVLFFILRNVPVYPFTLLAP